MGSSRVAGTFGTVETLPSGRFRARYYGPDGRRYKAPTPFTTKRDARKWLSLRQSEIIRKAWTPPEAAELPKPKLTFKTYSDAWLAQRNLKARTRAHYTMLLEDHIVDTFGKLPIASITADDVPGTPRWETARRRYAPTPTVCCGRSWRPQLLTGRSPRIRV